MMEEHRPWPFTPYCGRDKAERFKCCKGTRPLRWSGRQGLLYSSSTLSPLWHLSAGSRVVFLWLNHITHSPLPLPTPTSQDRVPLPTLPQISGLSLLSLSHIRKHHSLWGALRDSHMGRWSFRP